MGFDLYARGGDMVTVRAQDLRPPVARQAGAAGHWTVTFFPRDAGHRAKTGETDLAKAVAQPNSTRAWVADLCPLLLTLQRPSGLLLDLTQRR